MNPLTALFGAAVRVRNQLYDRGTLVSRQLAGPVISIGNLTVGGSGKTPFLILLGELLKQRGISFDVLTRGYRRQTKGVALVDPEGAAREFGDEPLLIARKLRVPVVVGEDRFAAGQFAERKYGPQMHLLDDGFQHRRLARDFDVVLFTAEDARDSLLPAGRLREPVTALARANAVVLTEGASARGLPLTQQHVWRVRRDIVLPSLAEPCIAFCGIAKPDKFFDQLRGGGIELRGARSFRDHHPYTAADVRELLALRKQHGATAFVTTEKDAINLGPYLQQLQPVHVVPVRLELEGADAALDALLAAVAERRKSPS